MLYFISCNTLGTSSELLKKPRIGKNYQAVCPVIQTRDEIQAFRDKDRQMWSQGNNVSDIECKCYLSLIITLFT